MKKNDNKLVKKIRAFLKKYTRPAANWDGISEDGKYNGPDPYCLEAAADLIEKGIKPTWVNSDWGQGCYGRWSDKKGREEHDNLLKEISEYKI